MTFKLENQITPEGRNRYLNTMAFQLKKKHIKDKIISEFQVLIGKEQHFHKRLKLRLQMYYRLKMTLSELNSRGILFLGHADK